LIIASPGFEQDSAKRFAAEHLVTVADASAQAVIDMNPAESRT
jgi:hypothetical protein